MSFERKNGIRDLLKGIETGDPESVNVINPDKYIQHNPQTYEGRDGLAALFKELSKTSPRVNIVRLFSDGDYVFGHTEYDFASRRIGFEVFRFEGGQTVEHWDNIQPRLGPNPSGHSMVDGPVEVSDSEQTEENRELVKRFVQAVLIEGQIEQIQRYVGETYIEHNPVRSDGLSALKKDLEAHNRENGSVVSYKKQHRVLAEGNFVLSVSEGVLEGKTTSLYDLYRIENSRIVEHWDTAEAVPPPSEWKNSNGKF